MEERYRNYYNLDKIANLHQYNNKKRRRDPSPPPPPPPPPGPPPGPPPYAFVTFLADDGDYVKGVIGLAKGLRKVNSAFPLVVAVLPAVPPDHRQELVDQGCLIRQIHPVAPPAHHHNPFAGPSNFARPSFALNYSKLRLWEFVEYKKMIYMDPNIQVFENIDHLFGLPNGFHAVVDCLCDMHSPPCPQKISWPVELGPEPSIYLNCGMFVFDPSLHTYNTLLNTLQITPPTPFAEQDFLNMFFRNISKPILPIYNCLVEMIWRHPTYLVDLNLVKVVHYCAVGSEPWRHTGNEENMDREDIVTLVKRWWEIL